ncbi:hypothetical protein PIB30_033057 [Stylosanthes scabra]|uniref:Uncharacterized protein n=1 Tax=Stylosanthes scabra TaxID=79078 RepID=A0ABU6YB83_9FABA|nr:hypothetical protein [Stylosanthes scabra]
MFIHDSNASAHAKSRDIIQKNQEMLNKNRETSVRAIGRTANVVADEKLWNSKKIEEQQRFLDLENFLKGKALTWFKLWKKCNPPANRAVFDLAFIPQFVPDSRLVLPEISWNTVSDLDVILEELQTKEDDTPSGRETMYEGDERFVEGRVDDIGLEPVEEVEAIRPSPAPPDLELAITGACRDVDDNVDMEGTRRTFVAPVAGAARVTNGGLQAW